MNRMISDSQSRSRLTNSVKKSLETTFIGAINRIEKNFGYLWGHGKEVLTDQEKQFLALWRKTRREIMDCGNDEIKRAENNLDKYVIQYNNYQYKFTVRGSENNGNK